MPKKAGIEIDGFSRILIRLNEANANVKAITEKALTETQKYFQGAAEEGMQDSNLPAGGKMRRKSGKGTADSIVKTPDISWSGSKASVGVGFKLSDNGLVSIFLTYGTPRMKPDKVLKKYFNTKRPNKQVMEEVKTIQEDVFYQALRDLGL